MIDINEILNGPKKGKKAKPRKDFFNMDNMFPKVPKVSEEKVFNPQKEQIPRIPNAKNVIIHNHYHGVQGMQRPYSGVTKRPFMSAMESVDNRGIPMRVPRGFEDMGGDGVPATLDPDDRDPNVPRPMTRQHNQKKIDRLMKDMLGED